MFRAFFRFAITTLALLSCTTIVAQETLLEEIIVTSQKREQAAQDIPISVFAITGDALRNAGIVELDGIGDVVAGLEVISSEPGEILLVSRGVTNFTGGIESTGAVGYYVDETPVSSFGTSMPEVALWDVDRVETLRGPQGTLFGEGSMAGTIRVITTKPDPEGFSGRINANVSTLDSGDNGGMIRGLLNVPMIEDQLAIRLVAGYTETPGWIDVPDLGLEDVNDAEQTDFRGSLRWTPSDKLTIDASITYQDLKIGSTYGATEPGLMDPQGQFPPSGNVNSLSPNDTDYLIGNLTIAYDLSFANLVSATSYFDQNRTAFFDISPFLPLFFGPGTGGTTDNPAETTNKLWSQEFRLVSNDAKRVGWTVGAYFKKSERESQEGFFFDLEDAFGVPGSDIQDAAESLQESEADSFALFADLDIALAETLSVQLGGRYYSDDRSLKTTDLEDSMIFGTVAGTVVEGSGDDTAFTPKISVTWTPNDELLLFGKVSKGFRSGGTNPNADRDLTDTIPAVFAPEELLSYEVGIKNTLAGGRVILNAYAYYNDWTDLQLGFITPDGLFAFTGNAGKAESTGVEVEIMGRPADGLTLTLNTSYVDATIGEDVLNDFGDVIATKGNEIPFVPEFKVYAGVDYQFPMSGTWDGLVNAGYTYRSATYSDPDNTVLEKNDSFGLLNMTVGAQTGRWGIFAFAKNLLNEEATTYRQNLIGALPQPIYSTYVRPLTIGVELRANFD